MYTMKKLFNGEVYPFEDMRDSKETLAVRNKLYNYLEKIDEARLKEGEPLISDKVHELIATIEANVAEQGFELGLSLGLSIMSESFKQQ